MSRVGQLYLRDWGAWLVVQTDGDWHRVLDLSTGDTHRRLECNMIYLEADL